MIYQGHLKSFKIIDDSNVTLQIDNEKITLKVSDIVTITTFNNFMCINCNKNINKTYQNGYCYICTQKLASCDFCIIKPSLCHFDKGSCRDEIWAASNCMIDHVVYLSYTSNIKVGITKYHRMHERWREQGAISACALVKTNNRFICGKIEEELSQYYQDKTAWTKMLKIHSSTNINLEHEYQKALSLINEKNYPHTKIEFQQYNLSYNINTNIINTKKILPQNAEILGIKGTYLIFRHGILSLRSMIGQEIILSLLATKTN